MRFFAHNHRHRRRPKQPIRFHIPSRRVQHGMARGSQTAKVRRRGAGDEAPACPLWQAEQVYQPAQRDGFQLGCQWSQRCERGVLVPCAGQPVRDECRRQSSANHEAKEARPAHGYRRTGVAIELRKRRGVAHSTVRKRNLQRVKPRDHRRVGRERWRQTSIHAFHQPP